MAAQEAEELSAEYLAQMRRRHSVRHFDTAPISDVLLTNAISVAAAAPSGANQQPWHFLIVKTLELKMKIRLAAEEEEQKFYAGMAGDAWISASESIGTHSVKSHLSEAPALIIVFAQRYGLTELGARLKHYYVTESVGIALGFLISALHQSGLACLEHTPYPMTFKNQLCNRPENEKPMMILLVGYPAKNAEIPAAAKVKKPLGEVLSIF